MELRRKVAVRFAVAFGFCNAVAVGCYGQTAKAVVRERVTLHDRLLRVVCCSDKVAQTRDVGVNESKRRKEKEESKR